MTQIRRASRGLAAALLSTALATGFGSAGQVRLDPDPAWRTAADMHALTAILETWLDRESPYPRRTEPVSIRVVDDLAARSARPGARGVDRRGLYDPETQTIYLMAPWSRHDPHDVAVLLHELAHHRQQTAQHWYCPGQQELPAYRLQEAWLAERDRSLSVNWIAVVLESGCTPRDIHPE